MRGEQSSEWDSRADDRSSRSAYRRNSGEAHARRSLPASPSCRARGKRWPLHRVQRFRRARLIFPWRRKRSYYQFRPQPIICLIEACYLLAISGEGLLTRFRSLHFPIQAADQAGAPPAPTICHHPCGRTLVQRSGIPPGGGRLAPPG